MLAQFLFEVVEEDVDESAAAVVEDMEMLTTLNEAAVAAEASTGAALREACIFLRLCIIDLHSKKKNEDSSSSVNPHCHEECQGH